MKLEPKAKPVRIRIKSGGEEHFSLDSLKRNFSVQDLWEAVRGKSLYRWLRQQNENELADNVDAYRKIERPTIEEYVGFSALFFKDNTLVDVNSLIDYYQSKGLHKNLQYVLVYVFDSLDYEKGKTWFHTYRRMKRDEDWINFFEHRLAALNDMDVVDCHQLLATLYNDMGDTTKKVFHLKKASAQLNIMAKSNGELLPNLLEIGDYQCVKSLFDDPATQSKVETKKWIEVFRRCKDSLTGHDQGECLYILSALYEKTQEHNLSKMCQKMAENAGYTWEEESSLIICSKYPKLAKLVEKTSKQKGMANLTLDDLRIIRDGLSWTDGEDIYYMVCYKCISLFEEIVNIYGNGNGHESEDVRWIRYKRDEYLKQFPKKIELYYLTAGLAWQFKKGSRELYENGKTSRSFYNEVVTAKRKQRKLIISTKGRQKCYLWKDSLISQFLFFLLTDGEEYKFDYLD